MSSSPSKKSPALVKKEKSPQLAKLDGCVSDLLARWDGFATSKERTLGLSNLASMVLKMSRGFPKVDWKQFALMHNASIIGRTKLEGGDIHRSISAWRSILSLWKSKKGLFFDIELKTQQLDQMLGMLKDLESFKGIMPFRLMAPLGEKEVERYAVSTLNKLKQLSKKQGVVYLPLGFRGGLTSEGHSLPCKFTFEKNGDVTVHLLNLGAGSRLHPVLNYTETQDKISFKYFPIRVKAKDFWGKPGMAAFCHIIRYLSDPPHPDHAKYEGSDLYDIFLTLGTIIPSLGDHPELFAAKEQRSGTCPEKGCKNCMRDLLISIGVPPTQIKKIFLNLKFCSLIEGYQGYISSPDPIHRILLNDAANEFGIALKKLQNEIDQKRYVGAMALVLKIKKVTKAIPKSEENVSLEEEKEEDILIRKFPKHFAPVGLDEISKVKIEKSGSLTSVGKFPAHIPKLKFPISNTLDEWIKTIETLPPDQAFLFLFECASALPIPTWGEKGIWDKVPSGEVAGILKQIQTLLYLGLKDTPVLSVPRDNKFLFFDHVLLTHSFYVVADKLARRCRKTRLEGFASPFAPFEYKMDPIDFTTIPMGKEHIRYSKISLYFQRSKEEALEAGQGVIFPIAPVLSVETFIEHSKYWRPFSQGRNHIHFLRPHLYDLYKQASNSKKLDPYLFLWEHQEKLPAEIASLYYISFLSQLTFFRNAKAPIPSKLEFLRDVDNDGKQALRIKTSSKGLFKRHPDQHEYHVRSSLDSRFEEMGIDQSAFIPFYTREWLKSDTNDAVTARLSEEDGTRFNLSEPIYRDLMRITRHKHLQLAPALEWAKKHLIHLEHEGIQTFLEHCFFSGTTMYELLRTNPSFIHEFRKFLDDGIAYYRNNPAHLDAILFLIRTGVSVEAHYQALYPEGDSDDVLRSYSKNLIQLKSRTTNAKQILKIFYHSLFAKVSLKKKSQEEQLSLTIDLFTRIRSVRG